jgi:hypothetical protein
VAAAEQVTAQVDGVEQTLTGADLTRGQVAAVARRAGQMAGGRGVGLQASGSLESVVGERSSSMERGSTRVEVMVGGSGDLRVRAVVTGRGRLG